MAKMARSESHQEARRLEQWAMLDAARVLVGDHRTASCYRVTLPLQVSGLDERGAVDVRHITRFIVHISPVPRFNRIRVDGWRRRLWWPLVGRRWS